MNVNLRSYQVFRFTVQQDNSLLKNNYLDIY